MKTLSQLTIAPRLLLLNVLRICEAVFIKPTSSSGNMLYVYRNKQCKFVIS